MKLLSHRQAVWTMVGVTACWSTAGVVTRQLDGAQGFEITFWRSFFALIALAVAVQGLQKTSLLQGLRRGGRLLWLSGLCWSVMMTAFMVAVTLTTVANVLVTLALGPLFTALVSRVVLCRAVPRRTLVAVALAGAGIVWMYGAQLQSGLNLTGTLVALCVPVAASVNWTVVQRAREQGAAINLVPAVFVGALLSCLLTLPLAWPLSASPRDVAWLAGLGVFQLGLPCIGAVYCARVLHPTEVALLGLLEVIFGIALAWLGAGETPGPTVLGGGALVLGALAGNELLSLRERRARRGRPPQGGPGAQQSPL